jgi:hypothetical protein
VAHDRFAQTRYCSTEDSARGSRPDRWRSGRITESTSSSDSDPHTKLDEDLLGLDGVTQSTVHMLCIGGLGDDAVE